MYIFQSRKISMMSLFFKYFLSITILSINLGLHSRNFELKNKLFICFDIRWRPNFDTDVRRQLAPCSGLSNWVSDSELRGTRTELSSKTKQKNFSFFLTIIFLATREKNPNKNFITFEISRSRIWSFEKSLLDSGLCRSGAVAKRVKAWS